MGTLTARSGEPTPEAGTTMVGLLGLLVVLGVLAASVVAAVNLTMTSTASVAAHKPGETAPGPTGRGPGALPVPLLAAADAAVAADTDTIRTAESAYFAMSGSYGGEADLVRDGFLAQASPYHDVVVVPGGRSFTIVCVGGQPCDQPRP